MSEERETILITICPYCGDEQGERIVCCGENHFEEVLVFEDTKEEVEQR